MDATLTIVPGTILVKDGVMLLANAVSMMGLDPVASVTYVSPGGPEPAFGIVTGVTLRCAWSVLWHDDTEVLP